MSNDLPDALIEKVARDIINQTDDLAANGYMPGEIPEQAASRIAQAALTALDISGIISDLRFYGDEETYTGKPDNITTLVDWPIDADKGQRARTRLSNLGITNNGGSK